MQAPSAATFIITGYVSLQRVESFSPRRMWIKPSATASSAARYASRTLTFVGEVRPTRRRRPQVKWRRAEANRLIGPRPETTRTSRPHAPRRRPAHGAGHAYVGGWCHGRRQVVTVSGFTRRDTTRQRPRPRRRLDGLLPAAAWCQNASLKENIVFGDAGKDDARRRLHRGLRARARRPSFPGGDGTEVASAATLSGGQQARVALTRAP